MILRSAGPFRDSVTVTLCEGFNQCEGAGLPAVVTGHKTTQNVSASSRELSVPALRGVPSSQHVPLLLLAVNWIKHRTCILCTRTHLHTFHHIEMSCRYVGCVRPVYIRRCSCSSTKVHCTGLFASPVRHSALLCTGR